ncbi:MAG: Oxidoreductase FAD-binding domain protein [Ornithinibacter sp.]|nr:Oxidoreductase FAD-binding domain protein [Ornithinibacter sp.]
MDTDRLKATWAEVAAHGDDVPSYFYAHLFITHPELRDLFPLVMSAQRDRLVGALGRIVSSVDDLGSVVPFVQQLGRDHRRFSVVAEHYDAVGASLLWTLAHFLGDRWTADVAADWAAAYGVVASTMVDAAEESEGVQPAWWDAEVIDKTRVSREVATFTLRPNEPVPYVAGQSMAMCIPQVPRSWRFFTPANAPRADGTIDLNVASVAGGVVSGSFVSKVRPGDTVRIGAPVGTGLVLQPDDDADLLLVAGNTGLAPFLALLDDIVEQRRRGWPLRQVHLLHGVRFPWNLYAEHRLSALAREGWFRYTPVVSDDPTYPGRRGLVGDVAAERTFDGRYHAMVCGSPAMVHHTRDALMSTPKPPETVQVEEYAAMPATEAMSEHASAQGDPL